MLRRAALALPLLVFEPCCAASDPPPWMQATGQPIVDSTQSTGLVPASVSTMSLSSNTGCFAVYFQPRASGNYDPAPFVLKGLLLGMSQATNLTLTWCSQIDMTGECAGAYNAGREYRGGA